MRLAPTRLVPFSYFCTCWKVRPRASPSFSWLMPSMMRRMRTRLPTYLSTGLGALVDIYVPLRSKEWPGLFPTRAPECEFDSRSVNWWIFACRYFRRYRLPNDEHRSSGSSPGHAPPDYENQGGDHDGCDRNVAGARVNRWRNCRW